jgi:NTE family protein
MERISIRIVGLQNILNTIKWKFKRGIQRGIYRNLVFKGGGVRGIAYMGAFEVLEELNVLKNIERVAGTSSGAIAATLVSFRKNTAEMLELFNTLDLQKEKFGWYSSAYFHNWLQFIIADQCRGNPRATFSDFQKLGYRDLHIVASNISRHRAEVFSVSNTPGVAVADAVRMSMSIPLFFEALRFDGTKIGEGDYYVDGGLFNNYPIHIFDQPKYAKESRSYRNGINWETLGLFMFPSKLYDADTVNEPKNLWEFLDLTVRSLYDSHQTSSLAENAADKPRTIEISDCGISSTQFDLAPESEEYQQLIAAGRQSTEKFFGLER